MYCVLILSKYFLIFISTCPLISNSKQTSNLLMVSTTIEYHNVVIGTRINNKLKNQLTFVQLCSLDEDFVLAVWTVVDSWADTYEISENISAGTAPWSSVRLVKMQTSNAIKNIPRYEKTNF